MKTLTPHTRTIGGLFAAAALFSSVLGPATAHAEPQGFTRDEFGVALVYGTFEEGPNFTLLTGGDVEEFCLSFPGEPGTAPSRVFVRNDGRVDVKVNDKDQPIFLYEQTVGDAFEWIDSVCTDLFDDDDETVAPEPFAIGTADLKVRNSVFPDGTVDVFNAVRGELRASDGAEYRVRASADFVLENGVPVGDPADFVSFSLKRTGR